MSRNMFGTDGIRGRANTYPMTAEVALALGRAAGALFIRGKPPHRVVIGKDTRLSGYMIEPALTAGFVSAGMDVMLLGPMPTPGVAFLTRSIRADLGVMVSASHNPFHDNGIKLFGPDGFKLSDELESKIEARMSDLPANGAAPADGTGRVRRLEDSRGRYLENLKSSFPRGLNLSGIKIVVDCAHGAAYHIAPDLFYELGAEVVPIGTAPNGTNINDGCGSTSPESLIDTVRRENAQIGVALDGDADRLVLVDDTGHVVDGDQVLAMIARSWLRDGRLKGNGVVATQMSNLGLERFVEGLQLKLHRTRVGDRYVMERMVGSGLNLGGEQSGHIIMTDYATTGDGMMAALQVLALMQQSERPLSEVARCFEPVPQQLKNVPIKHKLKLDTPVIADSIGRAEAMLGKRGRILVRPSGTEPIIRVMVEAEDDQLLASALDDVAGTIANAASDLKGAA